MKAIQTGVIAGCAFFLSIGVSFAAEMDDLDLTIRVVESDDVNAMHNELLLPEMISASEHADTEGETDHSMNQNNDARELENAMDVRDEHEDEMEDHDEAREDNGDITEEHGEAHEEETHDEMHKREDAEREMNNSDGSASGG